MKTRFLSVIILIAIILSRGDEIKAQKYDNGLIDKTIALIGNDMIQLSTLESEVQMMMYQGVTTDKNIRCEALKNMLIHKLFLTQARLDSLQVSPDNVEGELNRRIQEAIASLGGEKAAENYFKKPIFKIKEEWRESLNEQFLVQEMKNKIIQSLPDITPSDVQKYIKRTPKDSLPIIPIQYKYRQILIYPDKESSVFEVKERLLEFRERVMKGERFSTLATLYSQDPGSAAKGGELGLAPKSNYVAPFSDAAMGLKEGQVSQIVETQYGFHLIQMIKKEGDMFNARHILLTPQFTDKDRIKAFSKLDSIKTLINADSITFEVAARRFSHDIKSFINGGLVAEEYSGSAYFEKDQLNPIDYNVIKNLKEGEISDPFETAGGEGGTTVYKIVMLEKIIPSHIATFKDDFAVLQNEAKNSLAMAAFEEFIQKKRETTFIRIDSNFQHCPFLKEGWIK